MHRFDEKNINKLLKDVQWDIIVTICNINTQRGKTLFLNI